MRVELALRSTGTDDGLERIGSSSSGHRKSCVSVCVDEDGKERVWRGLGIIEGRVCEKGTGEESGSGNVRE